jgi:predicted RNA methylase
LPHINPDDVFVDLGCGKGRVVWFVATRCRLKRIMGIEIVPELARMARENIAKSKTRLLTPVAIVEGDASEVDLSEGTVYFLNNPFGEKTLHKVLENISSGLLARPRSIRILYFAWGKDPDQAHILDEVAWLCAGMRYSYGTHRLGVWRNQTQCACALSEKTSVARSSRVLGNALA